MVKIPFYKLFNSDPSHPGRPGQVGGSLPSHNGSNHLDLESLHHYGNFTLNALAGRNPDDYYTQHQKDIDATADVLRHRFGPKEGSTVYRGIILDPSEVHNGAVKAVPEIKFVSFSEDRKIALAFADPANPMAEFLHQKYPNKVGYMIEEQYQPEQLLYHNSWSKVLPIERAFGDDAKITAMQKEVILKPQTEYRVTPVKTGSSNGYYVG